MRPEYRHLFRRVAEGASVFATLLVLLSAILGHGCSGDHEKVSEKAGFEKHYVTDGVPLELIVRLDRNEIDVWDELTLTIEAVTPPGFRAELPEASEMNFGDFLVSYDIDVKPVERGDSTLTGRRIVLEPQLSGKYTIEPVEVVVRAESENEAGGLPKIFRVKTDPIFVTVLSPSAGDPTSGAIRDGVKPLTIHVPLWKRPFFWIIVVLVCSAAAYFWYRMRKRKIEEIERVIPPHEKAFEALRKLKEEDLIGRGLYEEYYVRLSGILRDYIGEHYGLRVPERTTEEFLRDEEIHNTLPSEDRTNLGRFLTHSDTVKFARYEPTAVEMNEGFDLTEEFVEKTVPKENINGIPA